MLVLALDIATVVGWASGNSSGCPAFGTYELPRVGKGTGRLSAAYDTWLLGMLDAHRPDLVIFEKPLAKVSGKTQFMTKYKLAGLAFLTEHRCHAEEVRCVWESNTKVKKHFTGKAGFGKSTKPYPTTEACHARGWDVTCHDEADACGLWDYAVHLYAPEDAELLAGLGGQAA